MRLDPLADWRSLACPPSPNRPLLTLSISSRTSCLVVRQEPLVIEDAAYGFVLAVFHCQRVALWVPEVQAQRKDVRSWGTSRAVTDPCRPARKTVVKWRRAKHPVCIVWHHILHSPERRTGLRAALHLSKEVCRRTRQKKGKRIAESPSYHPS
jgi:hypothetical protein